jgi:NADPH:quinone reductase-like Zn-dependent oxidoreductase/acyl carrier protein
MADIDGTDKVLKADLEIYDEAGEEIGALRGIRMQAVQKEAVLRLLASAGAPAEAEGADWLYRVRWEPGDLPQHAGRAPQDTDHVSQDSDHEPQGAPADANPGSWLILADRAGAGAALQRSLEASGHHCVVLAPDDVGSEGVDSGKAGSDDVTRIRAAIDLAREREGHPYRGAIHLRSLDAHPGPTPDSLMGAHRGICGSALSLVQASVGAGLADTSIWFLTQGARVVPEAEGAGDVASGDVASGDVASSRALAQRPLWGLVSTLQLEHPELGAVCVDLDPTLAPGTDELTRQIRGEIQEDGGFQENGGLQEDAELRPNGENDRIAWRGGRRWVERMVRYREPQADLKIPEEGAYEITVERRGTLDGLAARPVEQHPVGPDDVEIRVRASGLNFRDVLNVLGMYPGDPGPVGSECSGVVTAVGADVTGVEVGDEVMAMGGGAFGSHLVTPAHSVYRKPAGLSFEQAATIPVAVLTAWYGLHRLARIAKGDRVLIHAAAGGVGTAAVQIALRAGAEVFGTAGSPHKHEFLKSMGVHHVMNSRTLDFADEVMEITGGRGVDIVLNSLADDFIPKSLGVLADGGRFLEIGKRGVWTSEQVAELNPSLEYHLYDLGWDMHKDPALAHALLDEVMPELESGALRPLPVHTFPVERSVAAFRYMAQARHIGKIVLMHGGEDHGSRVRDDATYLVTGGLGGLGLVVARGLVDDGARHLVLMGRHGPSPAAAAAIGELESAGAAVTVFEGDVAEVGDVHALLDAVSGSMPPLRGVVHAAGVVDDAVLAHQSWEAFEKVARPKIAGAWNLHTATASLDLDFFVLFSTGSSLMGSAGQGNYSAANAFLDGLAHTRHAAGLPALSVSWGAWADVGMVSEMSQHDRDRWKDLGVGLIEPRKGWRVLERLMRGEAPHVAVLPMEWKRFFQQPAARNRPLLRVLLAEAGTDESSSAKDTRAAKATPSLRALLAETDPFDRRAVLESQVALLVVKVLGLEPGVTVDVDRGLTDMGMDSLMAVELSNHLQDRIGNSLPPTLAFEFPTVAALAGYLAEEVLDLDDETEGASVSASAGVTADPTEPDPEENLLEELRRAGY